MVRQGQYAEFKCSLPQPIIWTFNGGHFLPDNAQLKGNIITIEQIVPKNIGDYICETSTKFHKKTFGCGKLQLAGITSVYLTSLNF